MWFDSAPPSTSSGRGLRPANGWANQGWVLRGRRRVCDAAPTQGVWFDSAPPFGRLMNGGLTMNGWVERGWVYWVERGWVLRGRRAGL